MATQPMVLKLKPVQTKKIVAAPSPVTFEPVSKRTSTKYDDNKIAERIPIEEVSQPNGSEVFESEHIERFALASV